MRNGMRERNAHRNAHRNADWNADWKECGNIISSLDGWMDFILLFTIIRIFHNDFMKIPSLFFSRFLRIRTRFWMMTNNHFL